MQQLKPVKTLSCFFERNKAFRLKVGFTYRVCGLGIVRSNACSCTKELIAQIDFVFLLDFRLPRTRLGITGASSVLLSLLPRFAPRDSSSKLSFTEVALARDSSNKFGSPPALRNVGSPLGLSSVPVLHLQFLTSYIFLLTSYIIQVVVITLGRVADKELALGVVVFQPVFEGSTHEAAADNTYVDHYCMFLFVCL